MLVKLKVNNQLAINSNFNWLNYGEAHTYLIAVDLSPDNIKNASARHSDFKFSLPDSANEEWVNRILLKQFNSGSSCCYSFTKASNDFVELLKNDKVEVIVDLLYSPNYFYSVQAMEALIYLASTNRIVIDDSIRKRMEIIKQNGSDITAQKTEDLFTIVRGYKELLVTDAQVIKKYRYSLRKRTQ